MENENNNNNTNNTINLSIEEYKTMIKEIETLKAQKTIAPVEVIQQSSLGEQPKEEVKPKKKGIFWNE